MTLDHPPLPDLQTGASRIGRGTVGLPVIDVSALRDGARADCARVARDLRGACVDKGFFYITGHGIPRALIEGVMTQAARFFALPLEQKDALSKRYSRSNHGYEPISGQRLEEGAPPDLKESLFLGVDLPKDDPRVIAGQFGRGPNLWPPELPGFKSAVETYFAAMTELAGVMYRGLALSLQLDEDYFTEFYTDPVNVLRMIHYPPQPANPLPDQKGCGAHTDFGGLTLLLQDSNGGLQISDGAGWIDAPPIDNTYVVNLGDFVARWTNGTYRSTLHRVINRSGRDRYSIPFFANGAPEFPVTCIPTCLSPGETSKFSSTTIAEHFSSMYRRTYL